MGRLCLFLMTVRMGFVGLFKVLGMQFWGWDGWDVLSLGRLSVFEIQGRLHYHRLWVSKDCNWVPWGAKRRSLENI